MGKFWRATNGGRYLDALDKWQWLLECCGLDRLDRGGRPAQEAVLLLRLRNSLVHFKPENIAADEEHELEKRLRGKFADNRLMEGVRQSLVAKPRPRLRVQRVGGIHGTGGRGPRS
jgi:hypothetical protein